MSSLALSFFFFIFVRLEWMVYCLLHVCVSPNSTVEHSRLLFSAEARKMDGRLRVSGAAPVPNSSRIPEHGDIFRSFRVGDRQTLEAFTYSSSKSVRNHRGRALPPLPRKVGAMAWPRPALIPIALTQPNQLWHGGDIYSSDCNNSIFNDNASTSSRLK